VQSLFNSQGWQEIAFPLLQESIASVAGRFTNGRYYHGELTRSKENRDFNAGYQFALEEFTNRLHDFILAKEKLEQKKKEELEETKAPIINPFMEGNEFED